MFMQIMMSDQFHLFKKFYREKFNDIEQTENKFLKDKEPKIVLFKNEKEKF